MSDSDHVAFNTTSSDSSTLYLMGNSLEQICTYSMSEIFGGGDAITFYDLAKIGIVPTLAPTRKDVLCIDGVEVI